VLETFRVGLEQRREIDALEFTRGGDRVRPWRPRLDHHRGGRRVTGGQIFNVFTLREGRIVRIDDYRGRTEALVAAGVAEEMGWR
jgi:hypothetical protein